MSIIYKLEELLRYEQPTPYIVESTDYDDKYDIPVLTAGKSFILGYTNEQTGVYDKLPVIIFDDFTTASRYVNFPFKVKSSAMKILTANTDIVLPKYIYYRMQIIQFDHSTHKRYWIQQYSKIKVAVPPLEEQQRIVAHIEELFSQLDDAETTLQKTKAQLAQYRQAVLKAAFDAAIQTNAQTMPINQLLCKERKGMTTGPFGTMLNKKEHKTCGVPVLGIENIGEGLFIPGNKIFVTPEKAKELKSFEVKSGDLIISRSGTVGEICEVPDYMEGALLSTNLMRISLNTNIIKPKYFIWLFRSKSVVIDQVKELCKGSTRPFLNQTILKQISFPVPSTQIQEGIVDALEMRLSLCESIEKTINQSFKQVATLRQCMLKSVF